MGIDGARVGNKPKPEKQRTKDSLTTAPPAPAEKSLPLAIGLNFVLPGAGYIYLGRPVLGVLALLVVCFILFTAGFFLLFQTWVGLNVIMLVDMIILSNKRKKQINESTTTACPQCAEIIKQQAKVCRFCGHKIAA